MRRLVSIGMALGLFVAMVGPATAHKQTITDGQNDALDYSDGESPPASTATPVDLRSVLFSETSRKFVITIRLWQAVTPQELCDSSCSPSGGMANEGMILVDFFKGTPTDPKSYYFILIGSTTDDQYAGGVYTGSGNPVSGAFSAEVLDSGMGFRVKVARSKLKGYPKGAKLKWIGSTVYVTDENGSDCVPNETGPFYGACWDFLPDSGYAKHTLKE